MFAKKYIPYMIHRKFCPLLVAILFLLSAADVRSQNMILPNAYAHNDYWHKRPLLDALDNGFTYVEADVYLKNGRLIVTHILPYFKNKKTLEELYFKPLLNYVNTNASSATPVNCPLTLMIDIKSDAEKTYKVLVQLLQKYKSILSGYQNGELTMRNVSVVLTGHKPYNMLTGEEERLAFLDEDLTQAGKDSSNNIYTVASCKYSNLVKWKGKGKISEDDIQRLEYFVLQAHKNGRKVRLWGSPDKIKVWSELLKCNVDLINTDRINALRAFLTSEMSVMAKKS
jgi:glycerophosphoryl diester phosphodiesterase